MTMLKSNKNNIWSRVRDDVDVDDLIFNYEANHKNEEAEQRSDR